MPKTKLTPEVIASLKISIENGQSIEDACLLAGIGKTSFYDWVKRAERGEKPYVALLNAVKSAEAMDKQWHLNNIRRHAIKSWQASAWYLERRWPMEFGRREAVDPSYGQDEGAVELVIKDETEEKERAERA